MPHPLDPNERTMVSEHLSKRPGQMHPTNCELCDCQHYRWNGASSMLRTDPPSTCLCGDPCSRHVFRPFDPASEACHAR